ncbi:MAG: hypothetical protein ABFD08_05015 [Syntrophomonas sp.]
MNYRACFISYLRRRAYRPTTVKSCEATDRSLKPNAVYYTLQKFSRKISARVTVRDLRLAQFTLVPAVIVEEAA